MFYLHLTDDNGLTEDEEGVELAGDAAARDAAIAGLRDVAAAEIARGELSLGSYIVITNGRREDIATVSFHDAVQLRGQSRSH
jgi:hypothetical protein